MLLLMVTRQYPPWQQWERAGPRAEFRYVGIREAEYALLEAGNVQGLFDPADVSLAAVGSDCWDLMQRMLMFDPSARTTAAEALLHPWLA